MSTIKTTTPEPRSCERCDTMIPPARIAAMPETWLCIPCSEEVGGDFVYTATAENLAKAGSMKKNYGGITVKKHRRAIHKKDDVT